MNPTYEQLIYFCKVVREAAQQVSDDRGIWYFQSFPKGWCGCVSRVLGGLLSSVFPDCEFFYICGVRAKGLSFVSHAWIDYKDLVLDITADQFEDCNDSVIVKPFQKSYFHQLFQVEQRKLCSAEDVHEYEEGIVGCVKNFSHFSSQTLL